MTSTTELRTYLLQEHLQGNNSIQLDEEYDLIGSGILDSLGIMKLVLHLEKQYGVRVEPDEITPANFGTLNRLTAFLEHKRSGGTTEPR